MTGKKTNQRNLIATMVLVALFVCCVGLVALYLIGRSVSQPTTTTTGSAVVDSRNATLSVAYSPEKAEVVRTLADSSTLRSEDPDRQTMQVELVEVTPEEMVNQALGGAPEFQALTPDSSVWLDQLNSRWAQTQATEPGAIEPRLTARPCATPSPPSSSQRGERSAGARLAGRPGKLAGHPDQGAAGSELQLEPSQHGVCQRPPRHAGRVLRGRGRPARPHCGDGARPEDAGIRREHREDGEVSTARVSWRPCSARPGRRARVGRVRRLRTVGHRVQ